MECTYIAWVTRRRACTPAGIRAASAKTTVRFGRNCDQEKRATGAHEVGDNVVVRLHNGRIVEAVIKARIEKTDGVRLQVSFGQETALIHEYQVLEN